LSGRECGAGGAVTTSVILLLLRIVAAPTVAEWSVVPVLDSIRRVERVITAELGGKERLVIALHDGRLKVISWDKGNWRVLNETLPCRFPYGLAAVKARDDGVIRLYTGFAECPHIVEMEWDGNALKSRPFSAPGTATTGIGGGLSKLDDRGRLFLFRTFKGPLRPHCELPTHQRMEECRFETDGLSCGEIFRGCGEADIFFNPWKAGASDLLLATGMILVRSSGTWEHSDESFFGPGHVSTHREGIVYSEFSEFKFDPTGRRIEIRAIGGEHRSFERALVGAILRADGTERAYRGSTDGYLLEYSLVFKNPDYPTIGSWSEERILRGRYPKIVVGDLRGDGRERLYAIEDARPNRLVEISYVPKKRVVVVMNPVTDDDSGSILGNLMRSRFKTFGSFDIVELENIDAIKRERRFQASLCRDPECLASLGRTASAQYIVSGAVKRKNGSYDTAFSVVNAKTKGTVLKVERTGIREGQLLDAIEAISSKIASNWPREYKPATGD